MLKTMREQMNKQRADIAFESFVLDYIERRPVIMTMLECCGAPECDHEEDDWSDKGMSQLIDSIPETDIDDDADMIRENKIEANNEKGEKKEMSIDECCEAYIPDTIEEGN